MAQAQAATTTVVSHPAHLLLSPLHLRLILLLLLVLYHAVQPEHPDIALTQAQTFSLHSRPGATRKIFLDFDGHTTTGSAWNRLVAAAMRNAGN